MNPTTQKLLDASESLAMPAAPMHSTNQASQHTPGPWEVVATTAKGAGTARKDVVTVSGEWNPAFIAGDIMPADARLIAAAPELLAALEMAKRALEAIRQSNKNSFGYDDSEEIASLANEGAIQARAAIARATQS